MPTLAYLDTLLREKPGEELTLWRVLNRMRELDGYMKAVRMLQQLLTEAGARSEGLGALRDRVAAIADEPMFKALAEDLPALMPELNEIKSVTLGLNVNEWLEPSEVTLLSLNRTPFTHTPFLQKTLELMRTREMQDQDMSDLWSGLARVHQLSFQSSNPMFRLSRDIDAMLKTVLRDTMRFLRRYARVSTSYSEALYISRDVLKALRHLGCRGIFNTHFHDLAGFAAEVNAGVPGDSAVESLVAGMRDGPRSYRVAIGPPLGSSYAHEIAARNGLRYEQIVEARRRAPPR